MMVLSGYEREIETEMAGPIPDWLNYRRTRVKRDPHFCRECGNRFIIKRSKSIDQIDPDGLFCTLRCAATFAVKAVEASANRVLS